MTTQELALKWGKSTEELEAMRVTVGRGFEVSVNGEPVARSRNIVTNQGLDHLLTVALAGGTQITAWKVALFKTNTTPLATHTYAAPGYTEIAGSDVTEASRQAWTAGSVSSQSVDNSGSAAVYTADATVAIYGAALVGGGTGAATIADTAGGGTLYASSQFAASKALTASDIITVTYTFTQADDGA